MIKLLPLLMLAIISPSAGADVPTSPPAQTQVAGWIRLADSEEFTIYIDRSTIRKVGNLAQILVLSDYPSAQGVRKVLSDKSYFEFDCSEELSRVLALTSFGEHMGFGKELASYSYTSEWLPVARGSFNTLLMKAACGDMADMDWREKKLRPHGITKIG